MAIIVINSKAAITTEKNNSISFFGSYVDNSETVSLVYVMLFMFTDCTLQHK